MLFNEAALHEKRERLDAILARSEVLAAVLEEFAEGRPVECTPRARPWEPGGGATLFSVQRGDERFFLKVKSERVTVESRLEGEPEFSDVPSLRNEHAFLCEARPWSANTPQRFAYFEREGFGFLFVEELLPFAQAAAALGAAQWVEAWRQIEALVRTLYAHDVVHTDIHEQNLAFRGTVPVLIDFEEARRLRQTEPFERSLDVVGESAAGDVGRMPDVPGSPGGFTCLQRLREVFRARVLDSLDALVRSCNFDSSCPFLRTLDHGSDERIYQSLDLPGYRVEGQRPLRDERIEMIAAMATRLFPGPIAHLDIGANIGAFNIGLEERGVVTRSVGVEAHAPYVDLARVVAFLKHCSHVEFLRAECGNEPICDAVGGPGSIDLVTIYSVLHHIPNRPAFVTDLRRLAPRYVMIEMAVQPECYDGRTWEEEVAHLCLGLGMPHALILGFSSDYERPIVLLSREKLD